MRLLVVGAGSIGRRHAANAARLAEVAVVDIDAAAARACAEAASAEVFADLAAGLGWGPDGVIVATPTDRHLAPAAAALEAGAHVLIEKPVADRLDGLDKLLARAEALGRHVWVACNMRFHPAVKALKSALGEVGRPLVARAYFGHYLPNMRPGADYRTVYAAQAAAGGGVILDCIHELDYLSWLLGPATFVAGVAERLSDLEIDVEDFACLALAHEGGARSLVQLDYLQRLKRRGCEIVGSEGTLVWESEGKRPETCRVRLHRAADGGWAMLYEDAAVDTERPYVEEMEAFVAAMGDAPTPLLAGRAAAAELALALAARAAAAGGPVPRGGAR